MEVLIIETLIQKWYIAYRRGRNEWVRWLFIIFMNFVISQGTVLRYEYPNINLNHSVCKIACNSFYFTHFIEANKVNNSDMTDLMSQKRC